MALLLLTILIVLLMGGLATWGYSRRWGCDPNALRGQCRSSSSCDNDVEMDRAGQAPVHHRHSETAEMPINVENVRITLRYGRA